MKLQTVTGQLKFVCLLAAFTTLAPGIFGQNLLVNGSFENPPLGGLASRLIVPTGWMTVGAYGNDIWVFDPILVHSTPASDGTQAAAFLISAVSQVVSLSSGQGYILDFDLAKPGYTSLNFRILANPQVGVVGDSSFIDIKTVDLPAPNQTFLFPTGSTSWVHERIEFTAGASGPYAIMFDGYAELDNVVLQAVPEPGMATLVFVGSTILIGFRWRRLLPS